MNRSVRTVSLIVLLGGASVGCSEALLRETVFANTESLVGVSLSQNPRTQGYEMKAGFARSELFLVPTDKTIARDGETGSVTGFEQGADRTADVLAEIAVGGSARGASGEADITQRIAVGSHAVRSGAAVALMARETGLARAVNPALTAKEVDADRGALLARVELLRRATPAPVTVTIDGESRTFKSGRALGDFLAEAIGTDAQRSGEWDLRNARVKASDAQLRELIARWSALIGL